MEKLFEQFYNAWKQGSTTNPLLPKEQNETMDRIAAQVGIKRGTKEWTSFVWGELMANPQKYL